MVYTSIKTDNIVGALDISSNITIEIITMNNNQFHGEESFLRSQQSLTYSFNSLSFTEQFINIFTTAWIIPSHLNTLAHLPSLLTYILHCTTSQLWPTCSVHFKHHADMPYSKTYPPMCCFLAVFQGVIFLCTAATLLRWGAPCSSPYAWHEALQNTSQNSRFLIPRSLPKFQPVEKSHFFFAFAFRDVQY